MKSNRDLSKRKIVFLFILAILTVAAVLVDNKMFSNITSFNNLVVAMFSAITTVSSIWVACYLLVFQMYKDRFPLKLVKEKNLKNMKHIFVYIIYAFVLGCIVIYLGCGKLSPMLFSAISICLIINIFVNVFKTNESLMTNTYVNDYCNKINKEIDSATHPINDKPFKDIRLIFDESISKEEYSTAQNITDQAGQIFRGFLKNSIKMLDQEQSSHYVNELFDNILDFNVHQLYFSDKIKSDLVIEHIVVQNYKNLEFCIEANQYEWFKKYVTELNATQFNLQREKRQIIPEKMTSIYLQTIGKLIKTKKEEWLEFIVNGFFDVTKELSFVNENSNLQFCAVIVTGGLINSNRVKNDTAYMYLLKILLEFTKTIGKITKGFTDVRAYYAMYFNVIKKSSIEKAGEFVSLLFDIQSKMVDDPNWIEFKFFCISELRESKPDPELEEKLDKYQIRTIIDVIDYKNNYNGFVLIPKFDEYLIKDINNSAQLEKIYGKFQLVLNHCIIKDNLGAYNIFMEEINGCFRQTKQSNKLAQSKLYNLYIWAVKRTSILNNKQFSQLTFDHLGDCIKELDKNRDISSGFAEEIITKLVHVAQECNHDNAETASNIVWFLFTFLEEGKEYNFVATSSIVKKTLFRGLFNIGTSCIENNYEEGLRIVSNSMGWLAIYSIKSGTYELTKYLIERASELYSIAKEMEISQKTLTFILTLFTTIGTYCCKEAKLFPFRSQILKCLEKDSVDSIRTAIRLRTSENDMWNELYEGKTSELTSKFFQEFKRHSK